MSTSIKAEDILKRAGAVGSSYGFTSLAHLASQKKSSTKLPYPENLLLDTLDPNARDVVGFLKHVRDAGIVPSTAQPLYLWHSNAAPGRPAPKQMVIQFHALGADRAIADAVLMRAVRALMQEFSKEGLTLRINSMGDKETRSRFARELTNFFRKHGGSLPENCVSCAKRDVLEAAELLAVEDADSLPSSTDHLSEQSRKHFEGVLEYLESTETPYELAPELLSRGTSWTETCFEVRAGEKMYAWGSRYADLVKHFFKGNIPSIGAVLRITVDSRETIPPIKSPSTPRFVFVHIGEEAKRESMKMADGLRRARIPLAQSIGTESLTEQMRLVDEINPKYLIIMGRKEALDRSVILRERSSYTETYVPLDSLVDHLKAFA